MSQLSSSLLSEKQRLRIQTRHKVAIQNYGYQPQALFWSSREIQEVRFRVLVQILAKDDKLNPSQKQLSPPSLLDVGCGFGDLSRYLQHQEIEVNYYGLDLSQDMVDSARCQNPHLDFKQGDIFDLKFDQQVFDYVFLSGALNEVVESPEDAEFQGKGAYAKAVIQEMYRVCKKGVAFNLLDARNQWVQSRIDLQSFQPQEIIEFCQSFAKQVTWQDDYLENDFTVFLGK